jgi:hypothetical protein
VLVHAQRELGIHGLGVEASRFGKRVIDQRLRDVVVHEDEESDVLQGAAELGGRGRGRAWPRSEIRSDIQDRNHGIRG